MGQFDLRILFSLLLAQLFLNSTIIEAQSLRKIEQSDRYTTYLLETDAPHILTPFEFSIPSTETIEIVSINTADISAKEISKHPSYDLSSFDQTSFISYGLDIFYLMGSAHKDAFVYPVIREGQNLLAIQSMTFRVPNTLSSGRSASSKKIRGLSNLGAPFERGTWVKIPIHKDGIYQIDGSYLAAAGLNINQVSAQDIVLVATDGRMLPMENAADRSELQLIPVIEGSGSGENLQVIFYANGPVGTKMDNNGTIEHQQHYYSSFSYVFAGINSGIAAENIQELNLQGGTVVEQAPQLLWKEEELFKSEEDLKSGMNWLGQRFTRDAGNNRQSLLQINSLALSEATNLDIRVRMVGRSLNTETVQFFVNNQSIGQTNINRIFSYTAADGPSARLRDFRTNIEFSDTEGLLNVEAQSNLSLSSAVAWLDYIEIQYNGLLTPYEGQLEFYAPRNSNGLQQYQLLGFEENPIVLDVTNPQSPIRHAINTNGNQISFSANYRNAQRFIVQTTALTPIADGQIIDNQSLLANSNYPGMVIVTNKQLLPSAQEFADYRNGVNPELRATVFTQEAIFNRYSGGAADAVAIRDFLIDLRNRASSNSFETPAYLLFFGDATYDPKGINQDASLENEVITFQTVESLDRIGSYGTDDFFGLLDLNEGPMRNQLERVDIGIGRLPITSASEAQIVLNKIRVYENPASFGSWRNDFTFLADDELNGSENDGDLHVLNADGTAIRMDIANTGIRFNKIYLPSYPVVTTAEGRRVPGARNDLIRSINSGSLVINYSGHGAEQVLSAERVFRSEDIPSLTNAEKPTIFVTATCSFGRYDDDLEQSGAEKLILYNGGGAVASFTTTRVVYTSSSTVGANNFSLNILLSRNMIERDQDGRPKRLGDIYRETKATSTGAAVNSRKFILLGDPSMRMGLADQLDLPSQVNQIAIQTDTARVQALDNIRINGQILRGNGSVDENFNGEAEISVFDAARKVRMLERVSEERPCLLEDCTYEVQNDVLYRGRVSVQNGNYSSQFIVPRDIQNAESLGRIIVYAVDLENNRTSSGSSSNIIFNGLNANADADSDGPEIDAWLNSPLFADGNIVGRNPRLFVELDDPSGINTTGAGVGHELSAQLNTSPPINYELNQFYSNDLDQFSKGSIEFPLQDLPEGMHELTISAWDVYNNLNEKTISFEVIDNQQLVVRNLYNYPNPMNRFTRFVFEHNQSGQALSIFIRIFTLSGRPVTKIEREIIPSDSYAVIEWDGRDIDGNRLANGTYLYHTKVKSAQNSDSDIYEKTEKLVIIQ